MEFGIENILYAYFPDKQDHILSLMSTVQRLFNDFSQISIVGVAEIIALGLAAD